MGSLDFGGSGVDFDFRYPLCFFMYIYQLFSHFKSSLVWCALLEKISVRWQAPSDQDILITIYCFTLPQLSRNILPFQKQGSGQQKSMCQAKPRHNQIKPRMLMKKPPPLRDDRPMQFGYHALYFVEACLVRGILHASVICQPMWLMGLLVSNSILFQVVHRP